MRVWVDCTAAAHPLVSAARSSSACANAATRSTSRRASTDRPWAFSTGSGSSTRSSAATAAARRFSKGAALARPERELATLGAAKRRFDLAIAHGSVDLAVVSKPLRFPSAQMQDYEHAGLQRKLAWRAASEFSFPMRSRSRRWRAAGAKRSKLVRYPGLKEDYYLADFKPEPKVITDVGLTELGVSSIRANDDRVLVVVRPPPETSAYHADNPLYEGVLDRLASSRCCGHRPDPSHGRTASGGDRSR